MNIFEDKTTMPAGGKSDCAVKVEQAPNEKPGDRIFREDANTELSVKNLEPRARGHHY